MKSALFVHEVDRCSLVNGPGARAVVWVQGCSIRCPGCFNPGTHEAGHPSASITDPVKLGEELGRLPVDGLTLSGGEPLDQPEAVSELIASFRSVNAGTVLLFSGFTPERILASETARSTILLADAVLAGPYKEGADPSEIWSSKRLILVTDRIDPNSLIPERRLELSLTNGRVRMSGYPNSLQRRELYHFINQESDYEER